MDANDIETMHFQRPTFLEGALCLVVLPFVYVFVFVASLMKR